MSTMADEQVRLVRSLLSLSRNPRSSPAAILGALQVLTGEGTDTHHCADALQVEQDADQLLAVLPPPALPPPELPEELP